MKKIAVAAATLNLTPLDFEGNADLIREAIADAQRKNISLLCLPELCITGYGCEDAYLFPHVSQRALEVLFEIIPHTKNIAVNVGLPIIHEGVLYNSAAFIVNGELKGFVCKQHLARDGIYYEPRWFLPWRRGHVSFMHLKGKDYPCGDIVFDIGNIRIGFEICEDAWTPDRPGIHLASLGVDVILNPSASNFSIGKLPHRRAVIEEGSRRFKAVYLYANLLGNDAGRIIYDGDTIIAHKGEVVASGPRLSFKDYVVTHASLEIEEHAKNSVSCAVVCDDAHLTGIARIEENLSIPAQWENSEEIKFEEFARAIALGLYDYLRKSMSHGFTLSLSGGADSTCVAMLVFLMVKFGINELGEKKFINKLSYWKDLKLSLGHKENHLLSQLLHCVYQGTSNNSSVTLDAAQAVARNIGAQFSSINIEEIVQHYKALVEPIISRKLSWNKDDIALQNIQARVRSPGIWLLANIKNSLLLTTSNRSEACVGYATMDGDTSGGLAPIASIDKFAIQGFLKWLQEIGPIEVGAQPFLSCVTHQAPTAELRPLSTHQTDENDLMPYEVLAKLERLALYERLSPAIVSEKIQETFQAHYSQEELHTWSQKFYRLWNHSQWKRERLAPSFHIDDFNVDPRSWLRFPILSGGL